MCELGRIVPLDTDMGLCSSAILPEKETMSREEKLKYVFRHLGRFL